MAGLLSLDQAQMVGLMMVWVCVVVGRCLFFGSGCELCRLWCFLVVVCIILLEWIYYFIVVDILFYCDVYIILLY